MPLMGGLGNQLFQFAAGLVIQRETGRGVEYSPSILSGSKLMRVTSRNLAIQDLLGDKINEQSRRYPLLMTRLTSRGPRGLWLSDRINEIDDINQISMRTSVVSGYFQNRAFVESCKTEFLNAISRSLVFRQLMDVKQENVIAVHVRLGDKLSKKDQKYFGATSLGYFATGVRKLLEIGDYDKIVIVSDEPNKAFEMLNMGLENFTLPVEFSEPRSELEDLRCLAGSRGIVMSCSSFSWWGAWFASLREGTRVVAPVPWLRDISAQDARLNYEYWIEMQKN